MLAHGLLNVSQNHHKEINRRLLKSHCGSLLLGMVIVIVSSQCNFFMTPLLTYKRRKQKTRAQQLVKPQESPKAWGVLAKEYK